MLPGFAAGVALSCLDLTLEVLQHVISRFSAFDPVLACGGVFRAFMCRLRAKNW
jgi:hypothetical protein